MRTIIIVSLHSGILKNSHLAYTVLTYALQSMKVMGKKKSLRNFHR
jgi:hypothetical protein